MKLVAGKSGYSAGLFSFLKKPDGQRESSLTFVDKVKFLVYSFFYTFLASALAVIVKLNLVSAGVMPNYENDTRNYLLQEVGPIKMHLFLLLLGPVFEELNHRSWLRFSRLNVALSVSLFFYVFLSQFFGWVYEISTESLLNMTGALAVFVFIYLLLSKPSNYQKIKAFWVKNYIAIFYSSAIYFGYVHLGNFGTLTYEKVLFSPIIVLQFVVLGIMFGYVRVRLGLLWGIMLHIMFNILVGLLNGF
jgi:hypothetical protein